MQILRLDPKTVRITRLDPELCQLLHEIATSADPTGSGAAQQRLFSAPTADTGETGFVEDWESYVVPELRQLFQSALDVIQRDLGELKTLPKSSRATLDIPVSHLESWIHGLNQARLALAARYDFSEAEMDRFLTPARDPRSYALLQIRFYGVVEELFLRELESA